MKPLGYSTGWSHARPRKLRPGIGTASATDLTDKPVLDVRQADVIGPAVGVAPDVVRAAMIPAIDQDVTDAGGAHFAEGYFGGSGGHGGFTDGT